jgi:hypothetical protein
MLLPLIGAIFPFILRFFGENTIEKVLAQKRLQMESANELDKAKLAADVKYGEQLIEEKRIKRDLQLKEYEHPFLWWPKWLVMMAVASYWFWLFTARTYGFDDFGIVIKDLSPEEKVVSGLVMAYWFLGDKIERVIRRP